MTSKNGKSKNRGGWLDGLDGEEHQVFGQAYFFLDEGFGVADSG